MDDAPARPPAAPHGETDLARLLAHLAPALDPEAWGYSPLPAGDSPPSPAALGAIALLHEVEGWSAVLPQARAQALGLPWAGPYRRITCQVHSSLDAVGMLAAITAALAARGIACNALSALRHDHLLVPAARAEEAVAVLAELARG